MYKVSDKYRETIYGGSANNMPYLTINGVEIPYQQISQIVISSPIIDTSSEAFYVGSFASQKLTITFRNTSGIDLNGEVYLEIGSKVDLTEEEAKEVEKYVDGYEYVPIGHFIIDTTSEDFYTKSELVCMDRAILFKPNVNYSDAMDEEAKVTIENLLKWLCEHFGVELGGYPTEHPNLQKTISSIDSTISGKTYISWIAELLGSNVKIGRDGKLYIIPLISEPVVDIDALAGQSWAKSERYIISNVMFDNGDLHKDFADTDYNKEVQGNTLSLRTSNLFIQEADFEERVENIYNSVLGFEVWSITHENVADPSLDCWDIVNYNVGDITYKSFYDSTLTYDMALMVKVSVAIPSKQVEATTNVVKSDTDTRIKKLTITVDQQNATLTETVTDVSTLNTTVGNNYTELSGAFGNYVPQSDYVIYQKEVTRKFNDLGTEFAYQQQLTDGSVTKVVTATTLIDKDGVTIDNTTSKVKNLVSPAGVEIIDKNATSDTDKELFFAGYDPDLEETIVRTNHVNVSKYFVMADLAREEKYAPTTSTKAIGVFWLGD